MHFPSFCICILAFPGVFLVSCFSLALHGCCILLALFFPVFFKIPTHHSLFLVRWPSIIPKAHCFCMGLLVLFLLSRDPPLLIRLFAWFFQVRDTPKPLAFVSCLQLFKYIDFQFFSQIEMFAYNSFSRLRLSAFHCFAACGVRNVTQRLRKRKIPDPGSLGRDETDIGLFLRFAGMVVHDAACKSALRR